MLLHHFGLQLCDNNWDTSYTAGSVRCNNYAGGCKGAARGYTSENWADNCYPAIIWASTLYSSPKYHDFALSNGSYYDNGAHPSTLAFSVACVWI